MKLQEKSIKGASCPPSSSMQIILTIFPPSRFLGLPSCAFFRTRPSQRPPLIEVRTCTKTTYDASASAFFLLQFASIFCIIPAYSTSLGSIGCQHTALSSRRCKPSFLFFLPPFRPPFSRSLASGQTDGLSNWRKKVEPQSMAN